MNSPAFRGLIYNVGMLYNLKVTHSFRKLRSAKSQHSKLCRIKSLKLPVAFCTASKAVKKRAFRGKSSALMILFQDKVIKVNGPYLGSRC